MKNLIKKILKEENGLDWVSEVDPIERYGEFVDNIEGYKPQYPEEISTVKEVHENLLKIHKGIDDLVYSDVAVDVTGIIVKNNIDFIEMYSGYYGFYINFVVRYSRMMDITVEQALEIFEEYFTNKLPPSNINY